MDIDHMDLIHALHDRLGHCGHCGDAECAHKGKHSTLPKKLDMPTVIDLINELAEEGH